MNRERLQAALMGARERTGKLVATAVKCGLWQVQDIVYQERPRKTVVTPLSGWMDGSKVIGFLEGLK